MNDWLWVVAVLMAGGVCIMLVEGFHTRERRALWHARNAERRTRWLGEATRLLRSMQDNETDRLRDSKGEG